MVLSTGAGLLLFPACASAQDLTPVAGLLLPAAVITPLLTAVWRRRLAVAAGAGQPAYGPLLAVAMIELLLWAIVVFFALNTWFAGRWLPASGLSLAGVLTGSALLNQRTLLRTRPVPRTRLLVAVLLLPLVFACLLLAGYLVAWITAD